LWLGGFPNNSTKKKGGFSGKKKAESEFGDGAPFGSLPRLRDVPITCDGHASSEKDGKLRKRSNTKKNHRCIKQPGTEVPEGGDGGVWGWFGWGMGKGEGGVGWMGGEGRGGWRGRGDEKVGGGIGET